jgi:hypothetical protein
MPGAGQHDHSLFVDDLRETTKGKDLTRKRATTKERPVCTHYLRVFHTLQLDLDY